MNPGTPAAQGSGATHREQTQGPPKPQFKPWSFFSASIASSKKQQESAGTNVVVEKEKQNIQSNPIVEQNQQSLSRAQESPKRLENPEPPLKSSHFKPWSFDSPRTAVSTGKGQSGTDDEKEKQTQSNPVVEEQNPGMVEQEPASSGLLAAPISPQVLRPVPPPSLEGGCKNLSTSSHSNFARSSLFCKEYAFLIAREKKNIGIQLQSSSSSSSEPSVPTPPQAADDSETKGETETPKQNSSSTVEMVKVVAVGTVSDHLPKPAIRLSQLLDNDNNKGENRGEVPDEKEKEELSEIIGNNAMEVDKSEKAETIPPPPIPLSCPSTAAPLSKRCNDFEEEKGGHRDEVPAENQEVVDMEIEVESEDEKEQQQMMQISNSIVASNAPPPPLLLSSPPPPQKVVVEQKDGELFIDIDPFLDGSIDDEQLAEAIIAAQECLSRSVSGRRHHRRHHKRSKKKKEKKEKRRKSSSSELREGKRSEDEEDDEQSDFGERERHHYRRRHKSRHSSEEEDKIPQHYRSCQKSGHSHYSGHFGTSLGLRGGRVDKFGSRRHQRSPFFYHHHQKRPDSWRWQSGGNKSRFFHPPSSSRRRSRSSSPVQNRRRQYDEQQLDDDDDVEFLDFEKPSTSAAAGGKGAEKKVAEKATIIKQGTGSIAAPLMLNEDTTEDEGGQSSSSSSSSRDDIAEGRRGIEADDDVGPPEAAA